MRNIHKIVLIGLIFLSSGVIYYFSGLQINKVDGWSMFPTYQDGDIVISRKSEITDLKIYDVVIFYPITWDPFDLLFKLPLICHRIISFSIHDNLIWFKTKGDIYTFLNYSDLEIPFFAIQGKVILVVPRYFIYILMIIIAIIIPCIYYYILKVRKNEFKTNDEQFSKN